MIDTAKMIYQDETIARAILVKMQARQPEMGWEIVKVHNGHQVRAKTETLFAKSTEFQFVKMDLAHGETQVLSHTALDLGSLKKVVGDGSHSLESASAKLLKGIASSNKASNEQQAYVKLEYVKQSPQFLEVKHGGKTTWVQKSCVTKWDVDLMHMVVVIQMPLSYAKKRGFTYAFTLEAVQ